MHMIHTRIPRGPGVARFGPVGDFTPELGESFLMLVEQNGNYQASARALGFPWLFQNRMNRDAEFRRRCEAAAAAADARLRLAERPVPPPLEIKAMPPDGAPRDPRAMPEAVIRRASTGRAQIRHVREGEVNAAAEAVFLEALRETGNFDWSAHAAGFWPSTFYRRMEAWPAFARDCDEAFEQADVRLGYRLVAHAHALLRPPGGETGPDAGPRPPELPFDPEEAMRILLFLDRRKAGLTASRRKGPPDRGFAEVLDSILGKIEAMNRHEAKYGKAKEGDGDGESG
jgi:hypothetical protein